MSVFYFLSRIVIFYNDLGRSQYGSVGPLMAPPSLRAKRSNPSFHTRGDNGLLRGACHRARIPQRCRTGRDWPTTDIRTCDKRLEASPINALSWPDTMPRRGLAVHRR